MSLPKDVVQRTLEIIQKRGWTYKFSSDPAGPLNVRSALSAACTQLCVPHEWYPTYAMGVAAIHKHLGDGLMSWEFGTHADAPRPRTQHEVEQMLTKVINQWEKYEDHVGLSQRPGHSSTTHGTA